MEESHGGEMTNRMQVKLLAKLEAADEKSLKKTKTNTNYNKRNNHFNRRPLAQLQSKPEMIVKNEQKNKLDFKNWFVFCRFLYKS